MSYRLPTTTLSLPNSVEDIKFPVNRIADNITFNSKIKLIDENFQTLLGYAQIVDNISPTEDMGGYNLESENWFELNSIPSPTPHDYDHIEVVKKNDGTYLVILASDTKIDFYSTNLETLSNLTLDSSYTQIKDKGTLKFKNISYIKIYDNCLYVYDNVYETVLIYNLSSFLTNDVAISNIKFLKAFYKVRNVIAFTKNEKIYAINNEKLFVYNSDFNLISSFNLNKTNPIDIEEYNGFIYILYQDTIHIYTNSGEYSSEFELTTLENETFKTLKFSQSDANIMYVNSNKNIYKYDIGDNQFIGYFDTVDDRNYKSFSLIAGSTEDYILILDNLYLRFIKENIKLIYLYDQINLEDAVPIESLQISNLELEQDYVYNNIIQKLIFNTLLLYNSIVYKGIVESDSNGVLIYKTLENLVNINNINVKRVFYAQNEVFSYQTFNRAFNEIYNIQLQILDLLKFQVEENTTNTLII